MHNIVGGIIAGLLGVYIGVTSIITYVTIKHKLHEEKKKYKNIPWKISNQALLNNIILSENNVLEEIHQTRHRLIEEIQETKSLIQTMFVNQTDLCSSVKQEDQPQDLQEDQALKSQDDKDQPQDLHQDQALKSQADQDQLQVLNQSQDLLEWKTNLPQLEIPTEETGNITQPKELPDLKEISINSVDAVVDTLLQIQPAILSAALEKLKTLDLSVDKGQIEANITGAAVDDHVKVIELETNLDDIDNMVESKFDSIEKNNTDNQLAESTIYVESEIPRIAKPTYNEEELRQHTIVLLATQSEK